MNRTQDSYNAAATQGKNQKRFSGLLRRFLAAKTVTPFDFSTLYQEKLPIIYANIRV